ncbi:MAG: hypothetical protein HGB10_06640 [Coriobacteriia bacterium]|nr:hypothetical protein [Coriobacteriia bacterium]
MNSRTLALVALLAALAAGILASGCSQGTPPPPSVDNTKSEATASVAATLGVDTMMTVADFKKKLSAEGVKVKEEPTDRSGLFIPATYIPMTVDGAFLQVYRFKSGPEANAAARTVDAGGYILGATPEQRINVNWTGWPAFFRQGDLVVIFVTEKGDKYAKRDKAVYTALKKVLGAPFMGGNTPPASHSGASSTTSGSAAASGSVGSTGSAVATGSGK